MKPYVSLIGHHKRYTISALIAFFTLLLGQGPLTSIAAVQDSGPVYLVKDINPSATDVFHAGSGIASPAIMQGTLYFAATNGSQSGQLWRSDGTAAGTYVVQETSPDTVVPDLFNLTSVGNKLFFAGYSDKGAELWVSDGTTNGTRLLKDINIGAESSLQSCPRHCKNASFAVLNNRLIFSAIDSEHGFELWISDGTADGTRLLKDLNPGSAESFPTNFVILNNTLFFAADDGVHGNELWKSDGTADGTVLVKDIYAGLVSSNPSTFSRLNDTLYFAAETAEHGLELWRSDGTTAGTALVDDVNPGPTSSQPRSLTPLGNQLFFIVYLQSANNVSDSLWVSDSAGTRPLKQLSISGSLGNYQLTRAGERLFFLVLNEHSISELWTSDGTSDGTIQLDSNQESHAFLELAPLGDKLFFVHSDVTHGYEPWLSDGTLSGTYMLQDVAVGAKDSWSHVLATTERLAYLIADDGATGQELWAISTLQRRNYLPLISTP